MNPSARNVRKAAILLASLDAEHAEELLRQMSPAQAYVVRQAISELGVMHPEEQGGVIEEFFRVGPLLPEVDHAGLELSSLSLGGSSQEEAAAPAPRTGGAARFLHEAPTDKLVSFLEREHPQTIAVVISQLAADRAAEILAHLAGPLQIDVARRLVHLEQTDPEVIREVEQGLEAWLAAQVSGGPRPAAGVAALASILEAAPPQARHQILANLARYDRKLAQRVEPPKAPALSFVDLECMDSPSLAIVLHHADRDLLALALQGAGPLFAERAIELLGEGGTMVRKAMARLASPPMSDIEQAQRQLAELARQLEERGEMTPEVRGRLSFAV